MNFDSKNLIDYFCVCGLDINSGLELESNETYNEGVTKPPLDRSYKCKILNHFPDNLPWNPFDEDAVTQLCLPKGLVFQKHYSKPVFHPFIITREDGSRIYGGTLKFFELIEDESICNAMQALQTMYDAEFSHSSTSNNSKVFSSATLFSTNNSNHKLHHRSSSVSITETQRNDLSKNYMQAKLNNISTTPLSTKTNSINKIDTPLFNLNDSNIQNENEYTNNNSSHDLDNNAFKPHNKSINSNSRLNNIINISNNNNNNNNNNSSQNNNQSHNQNDSFGCSSPPATSNKISHYNIFKDRLYSSKCICLISQYPFNKPFSKILHTLYDMVEQTDLLGISLESHLYNLIYDIPSPTYGRLLRFHIGCKATNLYLPDYANGNELPLLDYDLFEFFRLLGVSNMINLYITGLLEHQILLYSKDYHLLMLVGESLTSLFFPFIWLKPYVPIVPASNLHFIEAPVPYIMGFHHRDIDKDFFKQGQRCFVDIDSGTVTCPEGLPDYPDKNKFIKEINEIITYFSDKLQKCKKTKVKSDDSYSRRKSNDLADSLNDNNENSLLDVNSNGASSYDYLQNSQAFARISELARKAGAISFNDEYKVDTSSGKLIININRSSDVELIGEDANSKNNNYSNSNNNNTNNHSPTIINRFLSGSSSGVSSASSLFNNEHGVSSFETALNKPLKIESINSEEKQLQLQIDEEELIHMQFSACIRELFLQRFVQMFASYEKFVIVPTLENDTQIDTWWSTREYSGNFDSKMFLIEQPSPRLPFLSHFISTQMFVSFIDLKIISMIDPQKDPDPNVKIFDEKIKHFKENDPNTGMNLYDIKTNLDIKETENQVFKKMCQEVILAPKVHQLNRSESIDSIKNNSSSIKEANHLFESIDISLLKGDEDAIRNAYTEMKARRESLIKKREKFSTQQLKLSLDKPAKNHKEKKSKKHSSSKSHKKDANSESNEKTAELNPIFIQSLLKESKLKTKRMLVEKMPDLGANLEAHISGVEENMLIASLCDLIERIWGHGLHSKPGKSALWNHLTNYRKLIQYLHPNSQIIADAKSTSPTLLWCLMKKRAIHGLHNHVLIDKTHRRSSSSRKAYDEKDNVYLMNPSNNNNNNNNNNNESSDAVNFNNTNQAITTDKANIKKSNKPPNPTGSTTLPRKRSTLTLPSATDSPTVNTAVPTIRTPSSNNSSPQYSLHRNHGSSNNFINHLNPNQRLSHKRAQSVNSENNGHSNSFPPLKNDLLGDLARIDKLTEVKTEIGLARAFVRLSLEKKLLADHLRQLLSENELLRALYKKHAFLRQEEEREQFVYHLQSLNVVDYFCFTNHFRSIQTDYSVLIVPSKRFNSSTTSANPYIKLFGSLGESNIFLIPKNCFEFVISSNINLGQLTTLVIGHDNAGMTPKWMIDLIFVRNEITGHIHKFPCGRWLGKGVDDDSLERLLIAEPMGSNESYDLQNIQLLNPFNNNIRSRSPTIMREEKKLQSPAIQEMLGNTINLLVKHFEKPETERGSLTNIMCGENGMVCSMDNIFSFGFKSYKLFKKLYVWDFLEKAASEFESNLYSNNNPNNSINNYSGNTSSNSLSNSQSQQNINNFITQKFISAIKSINSTSANYGKDGKFQIFICLACRDSFLSDWFNILCKSNIKNQMYDEYSFLRNYELNKFCTKILPITNQFNFKLENSLTMGINY